MCGQLTIEISPYPYHQVEEVRSHMHDARGGGVQFTLGEFGGVWTHPHAGRDKSKPPVPLSGRFELLNEIADVLRATYGPHRYFLHGRRVLVAEGRDVSGKRCILHIPSPT